MKDARDWLDERIRLGEIPPHLQEQANRRRNDPDFVASQNALESSDAQILAELPADRFAREVNRRKQSAERIDSARQRAAVPPKAAWGSLALASGLALFFTLVPQPPSDRSVSETGIAHPSTEHPATSTTSNGSSNPQTAVIATAIEPKNATPHPGWRSKGTIALLLQRETPDGLKPVTDSDTLAAGVRLRLSVPDSLPWAAIYSIDARGEMAQHWPEQGNAASPLRQGQLPRAWELDDAPGRETFVLVWSNQPFGLESVRKAIFINRSHPRLHENLNVSVVQVARPKGSR